MPAFAERMRRMTPLAAAPRSASTLRSAAVPTAVSFVAVLATFGSALGVERAAHLSVSVVIQAVVLAVTLGRTERRHGSQATPVGRRGLAAGWRLLLLPVLAVAASEVGTLMARHPNAGDTLFVLAISGGIWVRRFGPAATRAGTLATLPFIALLIVPAAAASGAPSRWWAALMAVIASFWVIASHELASRVGQPRPPVDVDPATAGADPTPPAGATPPPSGPATPPAGAASSGPADRTAAVPPAARAPEPPAAGGAAGTGPGVPASARSRSPRGWVRRFLATKPRASAKMAAQMAVGLGAAFAVGRAAFPDHWPWLVITAYIVASGNRGRGDVAVKSLSRLAGGAAGTVLATIAVTDVPARSPWTVFAIFAVLAAALTLRTLHYAFWAAGVTAMLALLYGYFGIGGEHLLVERLEAIAVGSALAVAASWLVLPVRSRDVTRQRVARAAASLTDVLLAVTRSEPGSLSKHRAAFVVTADELAMVADTLAARRLLWRLLRRPGPYLAEAADAVRRCREPVDALVVAVAEAPAALASGPNRRRAGGLARQLGTVRRAIAGRPEPGADLPAQRVAGSSPARRPADPAARPVAGSSPAAPVADPAARSAGSGSAGGLADPVDAALGELAVEIAVLLAVFPPRPAPPGQPGAGGTGTAAVAVPAAGPRPERDQQASR
jgi:hypothetical protein